MENSDSKGILVNWILQEIKSLKRTLKCAFVEFYTIQVFTQLSTSFSFINELSLGQPYI